MGDRFQKKGNGTNGKAVGLPTSSDGLDGVVPLMAVKPTDERIARVVRMVSTEPRIRFSTLARRVELSQSRLEHLFKAQTGLTLSGYVLSVRLLQAALMLKESGLYVKEIAARTGYAHAPSFVRAFKRCFGIRPRAYRMKSVK